ncbi:MAG: MFS transporter [Verrucomicrobia bacterium]|nr:MFS transporter [Verrucomicrobiota bacterium]
MPLASRRSKLEPGGQSEIIETDIPSRLDRLTWSKWHWFVVIALGVTWILDGLEVTLAGSISGVLQKPEALQLNDSEVGLSATFYLAGNVLGALLFGYLTDRLGRKKLFFLTLFVYLLGTALSAFSWNFLSYAVFRLVTGSGIGGEYAAINSAIDELIPARIRGRVDLMINCSYWIGAVAGAAGTYILLNPRVMPAAIGWRLVFVMGALLGLVILFFRHWVPESPRWLIIHGHKEGADKIVKEIEQKVGSKQEGAPSKSIRLRTRSHTPIGEIWNTMAKQHRGRSILGFVLMVAQAFFFNAIFFTYALVLIRFYQVPPELTALYLIPFALGNVFGPMLLGPLFDRVGRKPMIILTYGVAGGLLAITGWLFQLEWLNAATQTVAWIAIFFVASCAASSAYLTVSEIFPLEIRALAIALFYAAGTLCGGLLAPTIFGFLIQTGSRTALFVGYVVAAFLMIGAAVCELVLGIKAERKSLEDIATPLSADSPEAHSNSS